MPPIGITARQRVAASGALLLLPALVGCGSGVLNLGSGTSQLRFVAVSPGQPEMDFYVNGSGAAYGIGYESFTSYLPVPSGSVTLGVNRAGASQTTAAAQAVLEPGREYTTVLTRSQGTLQERTYSDQGQPAPSGQIAVRVFNELQISSPVTFYLAPLGREEADPAATFLLKEAEAGGYTYLPAGSYTLTATVAQGSLNVPIGSVAVRASSGAVRTVIFAGNTGSAGRSRVVGFALVDGDPGGG